jgi:hypothetical protein
MSLVAGCRRRSPLEQRLDAELREAGVVASVDAKQEDGVVHLSGFARTDLDKERIEVIARSMPGVQAVDAEGLLVRADPRVTRDTPEARAAAYAAARLWAAGFESVHVEAADHTIRLVGPVDRGRRDEMMRIVGAVVPPGVQVKDETVAR